LELVEDILYKTDYSIHTDMPHRLSIAEDGGVLTMAAIDVGSNAIRMAVGRANSAGGIDLLESTRLPIRLGQDAFISGQISEPTMQATVDAFLHFRIVAGNFGVNQIRAVATSAMREAENSQLLIERIAREAGIELEVISAEEEGRLIQQAVKHSINLTGKRAVLIDIGGGSVEVTMTRGDDILAFSSYPIGTVRLLQRLSANGNLPGPRLLQEYAETTRRQIDRELNRQAVDLCIGTGGNVEEIGNLRRKLFGRKTAGLITQSELKALIDILSEMTVDERIKKLDLRPDRADVILPAAMVLYMIAREARVLKIRIPGVGLKDGILWDIQSRTIRQPLSHREEVLRAAIHLGQQYQFDSDHGKQVARLAVSLFDQTMALHGMDEDDRLILEVASLVHDIGHFINTIDHDRHGYYIIKNSSLFGLDPLQQDILANIIRYHRKGMPSSQDESIKDLPAYARVKVTRLTSILRLADALEVGHSARVSKVRMVPGQYNWKLRFLGKNEMTLEKWALEKRKTLFQDVFNITLAITD
jgi:exopolyphosphatase / guanosine-5'-triphosphate,3'-diphosphate pyrophosphatase